MKTKTLVVIAIIGASLAGGWLLLPSRAASSVAQRLSGFILLQVANKGRLWYVNPGDLKRYEIKNGVAPFELSRNFGVGISNANFDKLKAGDVSLRARLEGRFLIKVQDSGKAFYVCPRNSSVLELKSDAAAFNVMTSCSLGISNKNLFSIEAGEIPVSGHGPKIAGCQIFPDNNAWNADISRYPVHAKSADYIAAINTGEEYLHPDFGEDQTYGIPYNVVGQSQAHVPINFTEYGSESDPGPYPIPAGPKREFGSDHHVLVLDSGDCKLYEMYHAAKGSGTSWNAGAGAVFNLKSNSLRPYGWTSADAAGLPILPGLIRYDEVAAGEIQHAIRFTAQETQNGWIEPATHASGYDNVDYPPMGLRLRLKSSFDISGYTGQAKVILTAMKKYGIILADNGASWYFQGATDTHWNDEELNQIKNVPGSAFEAVETGEIHYY